MLEAENNAPATPELSSSPALQGETVSFTGRLASMTHRQAHELVEQHGGAAIPHVSRQLTILVIGEEGWPLDPDGQPSQKLRHVVELQRQDLPIRLLNESEWLHLLGLEERRRDVHRLHTPAVLSQLLDVPVGQIRRWERLGLIRPVKKIYRLPYFDFQEVASARKLSELLDAGVSPAEIQKSLDHLRSVVGEIERPLAQLDLLARDTHLLYRDEHGLVQPLSNQRYFDFEDGTPNGPTLRIADGTKPDQSERDRVRWTADEWFHEGCRLLDANDADSATQAFRMCLMERPGDAEANFFLAESLYRQGNAEAAIERYYAAAEADHQYLEAWTQIGCLHLERKQLEAAQKAFEIALDTHPDYADAHLHLAETLNALGRGGEAVPHWQAYLRFNSRGPWADTARQRLEESGSPIP